jgi:hypothetical protein
MKLFGQFSASDDAEKLSALEKQQAGLEQGINEQKRQQMLLNSRRSTLEIFRNTQRMRAQSIQAGVSQGAQFGSGLQGGLAQIYNQGLYNAQGVSQNLEIGRNIFGLNDQISGVKMQMSDVKSDLATDQGWASLGGSILSGAGTIGSVGTSLFGGSSGGGFGLGSLFMGGGSPSGYGK